MTETAASPVYDVDEIAGPPKKLKVGDNTDLWPDGDVYLLPNDIPVELYFELVEFEERMDDDDADELALVRDFADRMLELFQMEQPDLEALPPKLGIITLIQLVRRVYQGAGPQPVSAEGNEPSQEPAEEPKAKTTRGATRKQPASTRRSSSRSKPRSQSSS